MFYFKVKSCLKKILNKTGEFHNVETNIFTDSHSHRANFRLTKDFLVTRDQNSETQA